MLPRKSGSLWVKNFLTNRWFWDLKEAWYTPPIHKLFNDVLYFFLRQLTKELGSKRWVLVFQALKNWDRKLVKNCRELEVKGKCLQVMLSIFITIRFCSQNAQIMPNKWVFEIKSNFMFSVITSHRQLLSVMSLYNFYWTKKHCFSAQYFDSHFFFWQTQ